jgi:hypothetical protein
MSESRVLCTCQRYCKGGKNVGRSTWYEHAPHRAGSFADRQGSSESSDDDSAESSSHSERNPDANVYSADHRETGTTVEDRPAKRRRIEDDPESDDDELDIDHVNFLSMHPFSRFLLSAPALRRSSFFQTFFTHNRRSNRSWQHHRCAVKLAGRDRN